MAGASGKVAVCGAGAMGTGIAQVAAQGGCDVVIYDVQPAASARSRALIEKAIDGLVKRGKLDREAADAVGARLSWTDDLDAVAGSDLVIEAIIEDTVIKADLFARLESVVRADTIIATNTSSLPVSRLGRELQHPERFVGMHFFNPAPVMKLVEIVSGAATSTAVAESVRAIAQAWGKVAIPVADVPGFIVNRVARPFYAEAFVAMGEGIAPATIDALLRSAGFRMGPLELADLIGHDVNFAVARSVHASYFGRARFVPQIGQAALVDAGWLGRKSGRGIYRYDTDTDTAAAPAETAIAAEASHEHEIAARALRNGIPGTWAECDGVMLGVTSGATARAEAARRGKPVAVVDWFAADGNGAVGFAASDGAAAECATKVLAALGRPAAELPDRSGLIVLRTLAQLANAAADAVLERVADDAGIDAALRFGANYPFGPLEWVERVGVGRVVAALDAIADETGEAMYRPSQYLRRKI